MFENGTKALAKLEYKEALKTFHCADLLELQEELSLRRWRETMDNSFARACFLAAELKISISKNFCHSTCCFSRPNMQHMMYHCDGTNASSLFHGLFFWSAQACACAALRTELCSRRVFSWSMLLRLACAKQLVCHYFRLACAKQVVYH